MSLSTLADLFLNSQLPLRVPIHFWLLLSSFNLVALSVISQPGSLEKRSRLRPLLRLVVHRGVEQSGRESQYVESHWPLAILFSFGLPHDVSYFLSTERLCTTVSFSKIAENVSTRLADVQPLLEIRDDLFFYLSSNPAFFFKTRSTLSFCTSLIGFPRWHGVIFIFCSMICTDRAL